MAAAAFRNRNAKYMGLSVNQEKQSVGPWSVFYGHENEGHSDREAFSEESTTTDEIENLKESSVKSLQKSKTPVNENVRDKESPSDKKVENDDLLKKLNAKNIKCSCSCHLNEKKMHQNSLPNKDFNKTCLLCGSNLNNKRYVHGFQKKPINEEIRGQFLQNIKQVTVNEDEKNDDLKKSRRFLLSPKGLTTIAERSNNRNENPPTYSVYNHTRVVEEIRKKLSEASNNLCQNQYSNKILKNPSRDRCRRNSILKKSRRCLHQHRKQVTINEAMNNKFSAENSKYNDEDSAKNSHFNQSFIVGEIKKRVSQNCKGQTKKYMMMKKNSSRDRFRRNSLLKKSRHCYLRKDQFTKDTEKTHNQDTEQLQNNIKETVRKSCEICNSHKHLLRDQTRTSRRDFLQNNVLKTVNKLANTKEYPVPPKHRVFFVMPAICCSCEQNKKPLPCDCEICECKPCMDPNKQQKDCNCKVCKCKPCKDPKRNVPPCDCKVCKCKPCKDPNKKQEDECDCSPCECDDCQRMADGNADKICSCGECECKPACPILQGEDGPKGCTCKTCLCEECVNLEQPQPVIEPKPCTCKSCICEECVNTIDPAGTPAAEETKSEEPPKEDEAPPDAAPEEQPAAPDAAAPTPAPESAPPAPEPAPTPEEPPKDTPPEEQK